MPTLEAIADGYTVTDMFAGAGGSSSGMAQVKGVTVVVAANHAQLAMDVHQANHTDTDHAVVDLHQEDPRFFPKTDIAWFSPECTKWSQANGGADLPQIESDLFTDADPDAAANQSRLLMFDVLRYIEHHRYRRVIIENVVDIAVSAKYAIAWQVWREKLSALGYEFRVVSLNSMHAQYGGLPAPQSRDRLYILAWPKGDVAPDVDKVMRPQAWCSGCQTNVESRQAFKNGRKVGRYKAQYIYVCPACGDKVEPAWLPAAAAIDWTLPGERIGDRPVRDFYDKKGNWQGKGHLAPKTEARIAAGIARYWRPFTYEAAGNTYERPGSGYARAWPADHPMTTLTTTATKALAVPLEGRDGKDARPVTAPGRTQTTRAETGLATLPFITELKGGACDARALTDPLSTLLANGNHHALTTAPFMLDRRHEYRTRPIDGPMSTLTANDTTKALITPAGGTWNDDATDAMNVLRSLTTRDAYALVAPYYSGSETAQSAMDAIGTLTTRDRYALVQRHNTGSAEMLTPAMEEMRTLTTAGHQSIVTPGDVEAARAMVADCSFRMLTPDEVALGMAFARAYNWQPYDHRTVSNRDLVKLAGNAVTPPAARDLMMAVVESLDAETTRRRRPALAAA